MTAGSGQRTAGGSPRRAVVAALAGAAVGPLLTGTAHGARAADRPDPARGAGDPAIGRIVRHMRELDGIAARHGGNRAAGYSGYEHSARYVERRLRAYGHRTRRLPFSYTRTDLLRDTVRQTGPRERVLDHVAVEGVAASPPGGATGALVTPADRFGDAPDSWDGVDARGRVALLELRPPKAPEGVRALPETRTGGCHGTRRAALRRTADDQTEAARTALRNAHAAGVVSVLFFLDGMDFGLLLRFDAPEDPALPPAATVFSEVAASLRADLAAGGARLHVDLELRDRKVDTFDVLTVPADPDAPRHLFGAHLDSVPAGPGIDDNASGSALLLDLARSAARRAPAQFCWWGGEEDGMRGSQHFVDTEPLEPVRGYFNMDMVAAPNHVVGVYGNGPERHYTEHLAAAGQPWLEGPVDGMSDQVPFLFAGVPVAGIDTVRSRPAALKTEEEARRFGGTAGLPYDPRYHAAGDTLDNTGRAGLAVCAAASHAVLRSVTG
ncbi:M28 family peptidase [Streptomyces sp. Z26]|uniref:M28 family peptidase n=1 Tax=Streptomyces sp. Z26 TaxID=2500177 RepID=UPI000FCC401D|nr:M28 family peptidase [Streptomyces sp. Z26]